ncbi:MAG: WD40/YVTN/BNR-like repeat-containing protein, partial [Thermoanaerobaculia bacterium]
MSRLLLVFLLTLLSPLTLLAQIDPAMLAGLKARAIGPATMSGRIAAIDAIASDPNIIYVGAATGGVWKSVDGGVTWKPLFDEQPVAAIGALAVHQQNPDIVWVGTGESNVRNSASVGNGMYRSLDGGVTWTHLGLQDSERISRIILHPTFPDTAWVAAMGRAWGENAERGIFKTTDGGKSWSKVLYVDERTGAADLAVDPSNPNKLIAAMWDYRRWPWFFRSGGAGSGLFVTHDGGANWKKLTEEDGLPKGILGRSGVAFSRSNPSIVYALVEAEKSALIRSEDGGRTWKTQNDEATIASRPFYYADIRVDPKDPNRVYSLYSLVSVSEDGGKTFRTLIPFSKIHPDHHALWIHPENPELMIDGNDGGVAISRDRGRSWSYVRNLPLAQYYHINVDMETPYNIYGGMQDNGSWRGPSSVWENGGIRNHHWQEVGFGDGFATLAIDPTGTTGYAMSQEGHLLRWSLATGERKAIRPSHPEDARLRFNWNAAIAIDPFEPSTVYYGSQFVHRSTDRGENWTTISPDLTTNNSAWQHQGKSGGITFDVTGAENFTTILTIAPSPVQRGVIWVGTDDGRIHVTRDTGANWASVEANVKGVAKNSWIPHIEPSKYDAGTAFVVFDDHRRSNWTPYVQKTIDFGRSWTNLATSDLRGYALSIEQDPVDPDLLFLGTEFGLFLSVDGGRGWLPFRHGIPTVSTMALTIHPREHDLVIGTHGRSAYVIDDVRPLRELTPELLRAPLHLFQPADAQQYRVGQTGSERFPG